jgi:hypothetical protein
MENTLTESINLYLYSKEESIRNKALCELLDYIEHDTTAIGKIASHICIIRNVLEDQKRETENHIINLMELSQLLWNQDLIVALVKQKKED